MSSGSDHLERQARTAAQRATMTVEIVTLGTPKPSENPPPTQPSLKRRREA